MAVAAVAEMVRILPLDRPWPGTITMAVALFCSWWGGVAPSLCLPPLLLAISRWHDLQPGGSAGLSGSEWTAMGVITLVTVSVGLAGDYRRKIAAVKLEHGQKLREQARALRHAHIVFRDMNGRVTQWSDGATAMFGWTSDESVGQVLSQLQQAEFPQPWPSVQEALLSLGQWEGEALCAHRDGRQLHVAMHWILYRDRNGAPIGVAEVYNDVSELRQAEAALRETDRRRNEFLATLAHELRNPLAPIRNSLDLLRISGDEDDMQRQLREIMEQQVVHLIRLVDDLLDVARVTHGKIVLQKIQVPLEKLVAGAVDIVRDQVEARRQELTLSLPEQPLMLFVDPVRMTQIIANLLGNASKYTDRGGRIQLAATASQDQLTLSIRDTGVGIPPELADHIFEIFTQVDRSLTRSGGGLGIGLTLVKSLVELHGGTITVRSDGLEQGSEFRVRLPLTPISTVKQEPVTSKECSLSRRKVLVVDDTRAARFVLSRLLEQLGQEVREASDGQAGFELALSWRPDVIFSDIAMPGVDGYELARRIRSHHALSSIQLVAVTGYGQEDDRARTLSAGFDDHITKPADLAAIRRILSSCPGMSRPVLAAMAGRAPTLNEAQPLEEEVTSNAGAVDCPSAEKLGP